MKAKLLRIRADLGTAVLLVVALWAVRACAFVNLAGMGAQEYASFAGKLPARCLIAALALGALASILTLRRLTLLAIGVALGFFASTLTAFWQEIEQLKTEAVEASDAETQDMVRIAIAETHASTGFWIIAVALVLAAVLALTSRAAPRFGKS